MSSTLKWIVEYHSMELSNEAKTILENNITQTDILYLTDEKRYLYNNYYIIWITEYTYILWNRHKIVKYLIV